MISKLSHASLWVLDQDEALRFYTEKLGFEVRTDARLENGFRWLTVGPPEQRDVHLILLVPGPPMLDDQSADQVKALIAKGSMGSGVFDTPDCRETYRTLKERASRSSRSRRSGPTGSRPRSATTRATGSA